MDIKYQKGGLLLKGDKISVFISDVDKQIKKMIEDESVIYIDTKGAVAEIHDKRLINLPGEYEINDALILAFDPMKHGGISVVGVDMDGVKLAFVAASVKEVAKRYFDHLGISHVVVVDLNERETSKLSDLVNSFDAEVMIPLGGTEEQRDTFAKDLGLKPEEPQTTLKYKSKDFHEEDAQLTLELLKE